MDLYTFLYLFSNNVHYYSIVVINVKTYIGKGNKGQ